MKRSKSVILLAPLTLTACDSGQYASMDQCEKAISQYSEPYKKKCVTGGGHSGGNPALFYIVNAYAGRGGYVPTIRYGYFPSMTRGGFGMTSRAMAASVAG